MDYIVLINGQTDEQLKAALVCIYTFLINKNIKWWGVTSTNKENPQNDMMCFDVAKSDVCPNPLPVEYNVDMVFAACKPWLSKFKPQYGCGDGSYSAGWTVKLGEWSDHFAFSVNFSTLYFGK